MANTIPDATPDATPDTTHAMADAFAAFIPKTWALIDARFPRCIAELVTNYFIKVQVPLIWSHNLWASDGDTAGCYELCAERFDICAKYILREAALQGHEAIVGMMVDNDINISEIVLDDIKKWVPEMHKLIIARMQARAIKKAAMREAEWDGLY